MTENEEKRIAEITKLVMAECSDNGNGSTKIEKRINLLQYINTVILTVIGIFATLIFVTTTNVRQAQNETAQELVRMKTVQDINVANVSQIDKRVTSLELNYLDYIKTWVDDNFVRKLAPLK
jgi:hypothetical protein